MLYLVLQLSKTKEGVHCIKVICDDTDVFILLMHFCNQQNVDCSIIIEATSSERSFVDIQASVKRNRDIVPHVLFAHRLTGCDTVAKLHGIGKSTVIKKL